MWLAKNRGTDDVGDALNEVCVGIIETIGRSASGDENSHDAARPEDRSTDGRSGGRGGGTPIGVEPSITTGVVHDDGSAGQRDISRERATSGRNLDPIIDRW